MASRHHHLLPPRSVSLVFALLPALLPALLLALAARATAQCAATFAGAAQTFQACNESVSADVAAYWTVAADGRSVRTQLVGKPGAGGYVAWAWGAPAMVGATAAIAYADADGKAVVRAFYLAGKSGPGVQPNDTVPLTDASAEIDADGTIRAVFGQPLAGTGDTPAIWAVGTVDDAASGSLEYHTAGGRGIFEYKLAASGDDDGDDGGAGTGSDAPASDGSETSTPTPTPSPSESPAPCIGAHHLTALPASDLVFRAHKRAAALCDADGSCATAGHVVTFRGAAMTMGTYCATHAACTTRRMAVNSPRMARGRRVMSDTAGLLFTPLSARFGSRAEELVLRALVRLGM